jgi:hypothetical protein
MQATHNYPFHPRSSCTPLPRIADHARPALPLSKFLHHATLSQFQTLPRTPFRLPHPRNATSKLPRMGEG